MKNNFRRNVVISLISVAGFIILLVFIFLKSIACGCSLMALSRASQTHSANVFKAFVAALSDDSSLTPKSTILYFGNSAKDCRNASDPNLHFGWNKAPGATLFCTTVVSKDQKWFTTIVVGEQFPNSRPYFVSVNGN